MPVDVAITKMNKDAANAMIDFAVFFIAVLLFLFAKLAMGRELGNIRIVERSTGQPSVAALNRKHRWVY